MPGPGGHHGGPGGHHGGPGGPGGHHHHDHHRPHMGGWGMGHRPPPRRGCCGCMLPVIGVALISVLSLFFLLF